MSIILTASIICFVNGLAGGGGGLSTCEPALEFTQGISACIDPKHFPQTQEGIENGQLTPLGFPICKEVTLGCNSAPHFNPQTCELFVLCNDREQQEIEGKRIPTDRVRDFFNRRHGQAETAEECYGAAVGIHEAIHAEDFERDPLVRPCKTEINAYPPGLKALYACQKKFCSGFQGGFFGSEECLNVARTIRLGEAALKWNQCVCAKTKYPITYRDKDDIWDFWDLQSNIEGICSHPDNSNVATILGWLRSNTGCDACYKECRRSYGSKDECDTLLVMYCKDFTPRDQCETEG